MFKTCLKWECQQTKAFYFHPCFLQEWHQAEWFNKVANSSGIISICGPSLVARCWWPEQRGGEYGMFSVFSESGAVWEEMTKHNWCILKDLHQTDTFSVTYLAFPGIPVLMDVTHQPVHVSRSNSWCQFCSKSCCLCSILDNGRRENILMLLKSTIIFSMGWRLLL